MPRIRTIKPETWSDEKLSEVSECTLLLALSLLNYADDEGYFNANPKLVMAFSFPIREPSVSIHGMFTELSNAGYLEFFKSPNGKIIGCIKNFKKHQKINRPSPTIFKNLEAIQCPFTEDSLNVHCGKGKEGKGKERINNYILPKKSKIQKPIPLPENFEISDRVKKWAEQKGYAPPLLEKNFEKFVSYAKAHGKQYVDWDEALMTAIRDNWAKAESSDGLGF